VPVLISLVYVALWARRFFFDAAGEAKPFSRSEQPLEPIEE
jgi:hypothetical protein